jgi:hypothetical protein
MDSNEREEFLDVIDDLKNQLDQVKQESEGKGFGDYVAKTQFYANIPKDPFSHQYQLIHRPSRGEPQGFDDLLDPNILLSNIQDSKSMLICQREYYLLSRFFDMGTRSEGVMGVFRTLYFPWVGQMRMTCGLKSHERDLQSFLEPEVESSMSWFGKRKENKKKRSMRDMMMGQMEDNSGGGIYE